MLTDCINAVKSKRPLGNILGNNLQHFSKRTLREAGVKACKKIF